ncbi:MULTISPECIES: hypothetical protein [Pseudomonas]|nr:MULTISPECIES: hypothetical protein [Pseudomonas]
MAIDGVFFDVMIGGRKAFGATAVIYQPLRRIRQPVQRPHRPGVI